MRRRTQSKENDTKSRGEWGHKGKQRRRTPGIMKDANENKKDISGTW